ncbi:MAG: YebC/PmpR family DNA-binding transcriptional regulator, partial [Candidatus Acetothermia bacterium]
TSTALKNIFKDHGGELGEAGCVRWMFERKGVLMAPKDGLGGGDLDQLQLQAIDAGAERIEEKEEELKFYCPPDDLQAVSGSLQRSCPELEQDLVLVPKSTVDPAPSAREQCEGLIESLEGNDDVQEIYSNLN